MGFSRPETEVGMVGPERIEIIAEIGENHLGNLALATRMIELSAQAGADYCKFQSYRGADVALEDPEREWFHQVALSDGAHGDLQKHCEKQGVQFLSSPFTCERAELLLSLGLTTVKVASSELTNLNLLQLLNGRAKRVFLSVHERPEVARAELHHWFSVVYRNPDLTDTGGVYGTPEQVQEQLEELVAMGANHLLLNPVTRYGEQLDALAEVVGLS